MRLTHAALIAPIWAWTFTIFNPPFSNLFTTLFRLILSRLPHKTLKILVSIFFIILSWTVKHDAVYNILESASDLIMHTFPNRVNVLLSANFNTLSILINLSLKFSLLHSLTSCTILMPRHLIGSFGNFILYSVQFLCLFLLEPIHKPSHLLRFSSVPAIPPIFLILLLPLSYLWNFLERA